MKYIEVEQKYQLDDPAAIKAALEALEAKPGQATQQVDTYYNAPHRDFLEPDVVSEWLRVREAGNGASINFKMWHPLDGAVKTHADEYETPVEDPEVIHRILAALNFKRMITVNKLREEWTLPGQVAIAFDTVAGAGAFVEFEFKGEADTVEDAIVQLDAFIAELGVELGDRVNRGYPHMLLGRDR
ncbi:class IV adenylate cyclase [Streptosporangium sp. NBC_01639]|uniref:class IV adenylate cyclase n=1 Tax=Streptosporangium sp. NBC_01639 TaxID=2975948 RepID=UPI0038644675|nr:class IV adenylate cyclase [Streptosporangium sp. NBC_01639]